MDPLSLTRVLSASHPSYQFLIGLLSADQGCFVARHGEIAINNEVVGDTDFLNIFQLNPKGHAGLPIPKLGLLIRDVAQYPEIITKRKAGTVFTIERGQRA